MKIGIFGDSFADENFHVDYAKYPAWPTVLREKYKLDVECHGVAGSSLYYSFDLYRRNRWKYDKVIFVATAPGRITLPDRIETTKSKTRHINTLATAEHVLKTEEGNMSPELQGALEAARDYFKYLYDDKREKLFSALMKKELKSMNVSGNLILVNTTLDEFDKEESTLFDASMRELVANDAADELHLTRDARVCHLSKRNNEILADMAYEWLNGVPYSIDLNRFEIPRKEELLVYTD